jgi:hypothetical protein
MSDGMPVTEQWSWRLDVPLPDGTPDDPYDSDTLAAILREVADRVEEMYDPVTGDVWDKQGRLLGIASLIGGDDDAR